MADKISRRDFLRKAGIAGITTAGLALGGGGLFGLGEEEAEASGATMAIAHGGSPEELLKRAIDGVGGIHKFVHSGNRVVIKPNLGWARTPSQAANTNPGILLELIRLCKSAGAGRITVVDHTCDDSSVAFNMNGARTVCSSTGVRLIAGNSQGMYGHVDIPKGKILKYDECLKEVLEADVFINVPIAKVHASSAKITAGMKNLMGTVWDRGRWHGSSDLDQCIADYSSAVRPKLIILDAIRCLMTNGPKGPGRYKDAGQVIASTDPVAIDAYAAKLLEHDPKTIKHVVYAAEMHLGQMDLSRVNMKRV
jgi:uncharacterized protein (DUF362 family)